MDPLENESLFLKEIRSLNDLLPLNLSDIADKLKVRGPMFVVLLCVCPFLQPVPIPGVSTVLGIIIALQGLSLLSMQRKILLFKWMGKKIITQEGFSHFLKAANKIYPYVYSLVQKRGIGIINTPILITLSGCFITLLALFLSLPLPIPASNLLPAIGIFSIALSHMEEDLILLVIGYVYTLVMFIFVFYSIAFISEMSWDNFF